MLVQFCCIKIEVPCVCKCIRLKKEHIDIALLVNALEPFGVHMKLIVHAVAL